MAKAFKIIGISIIILVVIIVFYFVILQIYNPFCKTEGEGGEVGSVITSLPKLIISVPSMIVFIFSPNQKCCSGLNKIGPDSPDSFSGECVRPIGAQGPYVCAKCGDGICGKGENRCNCSQDCK
jgi:hypothetical protein